ncbi:MAG: nucleotide sugar dehydrogenase [Saprospiraceae bacterium]|nr:nucleotide sugar dehydrogenase [Saprospiraceae bacterium]MCB9322269.1 nucleotide sugar dehydrogenase [Lewinellaceae bacterium]
MEILLNHNHTVSWKLNKIGVIGPGIVGMPMAALLAHARIKLDSDTPAKVVVVQRNSINSGWKVDAINNGQSVIGGIEPHLEEIVKEAVAAGLLSATHHYYDIADADMILICVQTDKKGFEPDYGPMFEALTALAEVLQKKPEEKVPVIVFESTLAPSSMGTVIQEHFEKFGLIEGQDILLGNSPNRVMPGRLVERISDSDKLVAGLHPETGRIIKTVYEHIVTKGKLFITNSLSAEITKTLENAYRDVRIAFSTEVVRYCDQHDLDFYHLRDKVNKRLSLEDEASFNPNAVPSGGLLIPTLGVGGHCLPKDGILLLWRKIESGSDTSDSLLLKAREINEASPAETIRLAERKFGSLRYKKIAILGTAYRFNSEDTRNSPSIVLASALMGREVEVILHDPFVKKDDQNLLKAGLVKYFTNDLEAAIREANLILFATGHKIYLTKIERILRGAKKLNGIIDACNLFNRATMESAEMSYTGIGRGSKIPDKKFIDFVHDTFKIVEKGCSNEVVQTIQFLNDHFVTESYNKADFKNIRKLAASCNTACDLVPPGPVAPLHDYRGFIPLLALCAAKQFCLI